MASRKEEKEQRRREREERERAEAARAGRRRRLQIVFGGLLAVAAVAAVVIAVTAGGDDGGGEQARADVPIPERQEENLNRAARAAGCTLESPEEEGRDHTEEEVEYDSNPPSSGPHHPQPAPDGVYDPANTPSMEALVHTLEHGRVLVQYRSGTPERTVAQLETLFNEDPYHMVLLQNNTGMPYQVAATAWTQKLGCEEMNDRVFDAIRAFRDSYRDQAPEFVP
jgi:hypothetical protein